MSPFFWVVLFHKTKRVFPPHTSPQRNGTLDATAGQEARQAHFFLPFVFLVSVAIAISDEY
jgi:hypothetical protein